MLNYALPRITSAFAYGCELISLLLDCSKYGLRHSCGAELCTAMQTVAQRPYIIVVATCKHYGVIFRTLGTHIMVSLFME